MLVGYARVSTDGQNLDRQIDALKAVGVDSRVLYQEKITGTKKDRPELQRMLNELNEGDVVIITDLTRISRSTKDLLDIVEKIKKDLKVNTVLEDGNTIKFGNNLPHDELIKKLSKYKIDRILIEEATLEDMFLHYYK